MDIETLSIGGLELREVVARVGGPTAAGGTPAYTADPTASGVDGWIGLSYVPAAWAILPSQGLVRFAPLSQGPDLIKALGGKALPYRTTPARKETFEKEKIFRRATGPIVSVEIGGIRVDAIPTFSRWSNAIRTDVELPPETALALVQGSRYAWAETRLAGQSASAWAHLDGNLTRLNAPQMINDYTDAIIGGRVLSGFDIAADPANLGLAFRQFEGEAKRASSLDLALKDAQDKIAAAAAPPPPAGAGGDDKDKKKKQDEEEAAADATPSTDPPGSPDLYTRLGDLLRRSGDLAGAIEAYRTPLAFEGGADSCANHLTLGKALLDANQIPEAQTAFAAAATLYHAWWDLPLEERETLLEEREELEPAEAKDATPKKQPGSCFVADDHLAVTHILQGDLAAVAALYQEHLDLSPGLAVAQGNAAFLQGDLATAQAAYRQALQREAAPDVIHRLGLAIYFQNTGDWGSARTLYQQALALNPYDVMAAQLWVDAAARAGSPASALRPVDDFLKAHPDSAAAHIAYVRAAQAAGDEAQITKSIRLGKQFFAREAALYPHSTDFAAAHALLLVEAGEWDAAQPLAEKVLLQDPSNRLAWLALGNLHVRRGDVARGEALLRRAGQHDPLNPGYALLLNTRISPQE